MDEVTYKNTFFHSLRQSLVMALILLLLCGFVFPVLLTGLSSILFPSQASGSLVYGDGQAVDYENYQDLYQLVLSQSVLSTDPVEYDANSFALQVTYEYFDGSEDDVITYCQVPGQDERYAALLNGEFNGLVRRSEISNVLEKIPMTYNNEAIE